DGLLQSARAAGPPERLSRRIVTEIGIVLRNNDFAMANPYNGGSRLSNEVPVIWVLLGSKAGDNAQVLHIARALGLSFDTNTLVMWREYDTGKPAVSASLDHLDATRSDKLEPPWPD